MSDFSGYLLKFGNTVFPHEYLQFKTYKPVPNQRTELSAFRDNNNYLHRNTSPNHKTTLKFTTIPVNLAQKKEIQNAMMDGLINGKERKYHITYWNDETNQYVSADFYMPDITYTIVSITDDSINYEPISYEFIQY